MASSDAGTALPTLPAHIHLHLDDIPADLDLGPVIAVDTETMGLNPHRDRLCLVQLSSGDSSAHLVKFAAPTADRPAEDVFAAPNLKAQLGDPNRLKLFHFGRFDIAVLYHALGVLCTPVYCTKIASKLVRTYTDKHGLQELCRTLLSVEISKQQQSSDWGAPMLTPEQANYAASDVLYLHRLKARFDDILEREGRTDLAQSCYDFLPTRARLDLAGWPELDIFAH